MPTLILLALCLLTPVVTTAQSLAPSGWDAGLKLTEAADLNPDPKVVEVNLTARLAEVEVAPGKRVHVTSGGCTQGVPPTQYARILDFSGCRTAP